MHRQLKKSVIWGMLLVCFNLHANPPSVKGTQNQLKQLDSKITNLQKTLSMAKNKQGLLNKELGLADKKIKEVAGQLHIMQNQLNQNKLAVTRLEHSIQESKTTLLTQQNLLAQHLRARYQLGEYQPLKWLVNQEDPYKISRILTYYQYIIASRQQLISKIHQTQKNINREQSLLTQKLNSAEKLKNQLTENQQQLETNKQYQATLLKTLNQEIQTQQHTLTDFQKDKDKLAQLLKSLTLQSVVQNSKPFLAMRKKLPKPLQNNPTSLQKMNQGITFFAEAGTVVKAVHPGKVVFSDWLNGYGWLLILDHGQGFMTLYAHNQTLFKHKGEVVGQNERIASVGNSGRIKQNGLYFEIRQKGKAIPPLDWFI